MLRILHLEDDLNDAELVEASLEAEGIRCAVTRVDTQADFLTCLADGQFDLILADYTLPVFDGISALKLAREKRADLPFIFVSGTLAEDTAIEALKLGATDYVFKTRLSRIGPSVQRALSEARQQSRRQQAEEALARSQSYLAKAQRLSRTGSFGWRVSTGEMYWSAETFRIFEVDPATTPRLDLIAQLTHPGDRDLLREVVEAATRQRTEFDFEHRLLIADGSPRDGSPRDGSPRDGSPRDGSPRDGSVKYVRVVGHPAEHAESGDLEFVGAVTDITERKRAEKELQQLVDLVPQIIVVLGPDGRWIHTNRVAREYLGFAPEEYRSEDAIGKIIHPDDAEEFTGFRQRGFRGGEPFELEARLLGKDGAHRWFLIRYNPLVEDGAVRRWYATATEIESRKQEEERVRRENVRLEERTRIAQELHDTLLQTFTSAFLQLTSAMHGVPADLTVKPRLNRVLQIIQQGIDEGRNAILGLRSLETNTEDLIPALSRTQQELDVPSETEFRVTVVGRERELPPEIHHEVYRIGREALSNAFCHSGARSVSLEVEYGEREMCIRIRDDGRGMNPQLIENGREGHWGLAGMRERTARIGGALRISSTPGAGTNIDLIIPNHVAFRTAD